MRPVPFRALIDRIFAEARLRGEIFGIPLEQIYRKQDSRLWPVCSQVCSTPVGPAAGPHTQLAQNIIACYLSGGRFIELKTVQQLDTLEIEKPCIDARDEAYNTEWSSEFTLPKAYDEYLKAWVCMHLLQRLIEPQGSFIYSMSVGYDLEGIRTEKMQLFIDSMIDASRQRRFAAYCETLEHLLEDGTFASGTPWHFAADSCRGMTAHIPACISPTVTLSTMHGCPPEEIESICTYLLEEKQLDTYVKLNPTLLGYRRVRDILDRLGYAYVKLSESSFTHDLQYPDAAAMLTRLMERAHKLGRKFGVKLSNTLGTVNDQGVLPGEEMYLSGRALYPLTVSLASELAREFGGKLPISFSGGANEEVTPKLLAAGVYPVTAATEFLKPSGCYRLHDMAAASEDAEPPDHAGHVDADLLAELAEASLRDPQWKKEYRNEGRAAVPGPLPLYDCYTAPCVHACAISQEIPEYLHLCGEGCYEEALGLIWDANPLPNITGYICDHQCMYACTRIDYEGTVSIRELKRIAAEHGHKEFLLSLSSPPSIGRKAAVVGAGPAGLAAASFLAREGVEVTVFEREARPGGIVRYVIPGFRFPEKAIDSDVELLTALGVTFVFNADADAVTAASLMSQGFDAVIYAIGAEKNQPLTLEEPSDKVVNSLDFLWQFRNVPEDLNPGRRVLVVGGGNTAMDSARAAAAVDGVEHVRVLYRRTIDEMPADMEEYRNAIADGVQFTFLAAPVSYRNGVLNCRVMELGEPDADGRRRPLPTGETFACEADTVITAVGERVDSEALKRYGVPLTGEGWAAADPETQETPERNIYVIGDAADGPSTVVRCIASARRAAEALLSRFSAESEPEGESGLEELGAGIDELDLFREGEQAFYRELTSKKRSHRPQGVLGNLDDAAYAGIEASRCLECSYICNKCVDVCPNRANITVDTRELERYAHPFQIVHLDTFCNECGNCATFCPWEGKPYTDKFTIFSRRDDFAGSKNPGILLEGEELSMRLDKKEHTCRVSGGVLEDEASAGEHGKLISLLLADYRHLFGEVEA